jgi:phosphoserine phosphatase
VTLSPGAKTLFRVLKYLDYNIALVSGGFDFIVEHLSKDLGADAFKANRLEVIDGVLTGQIQGDVIDRNAKAQALIRFAQEFDIPIERTIAIGDGANDIDMMSVAGLGIAFNAKPAVQKAADTSVNVPYLDSILYLLGITRGEIEQLNRELGAASFPLGNDER